MYYHMTISPVKCDNGYTEEPTNSYRWRKKLIFGKTLERAWKVTEHADRSVHFIWKKVHSVEWNADGLTEYA